jgi:RNA polymerase sigma factor (sigma-70 family)
MPGENINELCNAARGGDAADEERLFEALSARFRVFANQRVSDKQEAEEIVQRALLTIFGEYKAVKFQTSFAAWAYRVLDNRIMGYIQRKMRQSGRNERLCENVDYSSAAMSEPNPELEIRLLECLRRIKKTNRRYARILNLHYQGYSTGEICRRLNLTTSNFYSILSRARSLLELCLEKGDIK